MTVLVGQRFFRVTPMHGSRPPYTDWVSVTKVGRKWAEFVVVGKETYNHLGGRFDIETFGVDGRGFSDAGRVYVSEDAYYASTRASALWEELHRQLGRMWNRPDNIDELAILKAADALGIKLEGE
jgi:hypothetical protein